MELYILILIITLLILTMLIINYKKFFFEKFIVNPNLFFSESGAIKEMRKFRACELEPNPYICSLNKKNIISPLPIERLPYRRHLNYQLSGNVRHLFPPAKPIRVHPNF